MFYTAKSSESLVSNRKPDRLVATVEKAAKWGPFFGNHANDCTEGAAYAAQLAEEAVK